MSSINYLEAIVVGALQGVSELFPVSSLGHSVLFPALVGGRWASDLSMTGTDSPYLAVLVAMHVATALALVVFFWSDWVRLIGALVGSVRRRRVRTPDERLVWLLLLATIPVGLAGLVLERALRTTLGRPVPAAIFLALNGVVLYAAERMRRPAVQAGSAGPRAAADLVDPAATTQVMDVVDPAAPTQVIDLADPGDRRLAALSVREAVLIGATQILALLPGISRSGITIVGGLARGLRHDDAARFAFLLSTPVILAAGVLKVPGLFAPEYHAVLGPALVGSLVAGLCAYAAVRFLTSYFETRTLTPFAVYCVVVGLGSLVYLAG
ncbi:MAG TPA: undecaprenyl-diphosphate phosphatase [Pseudonocardia sp.]|jgi:undecaprenyl-diphosphatase|nr:undecaprenyl-diphosphate phosphatase [Pseudonocardia sp.]